MKYFRLECEYKKEIVGPYPQSEGMAEYYQYDSTNSIRNLNYDNDFEPNLDAIQLVKAAKLTDRLSVVVIGSLIGIIISKEVKSLLKNYELPKHQFFRAKVLNHQRQEVKEKQYFLFRILEHQNQHINFDKSEFYIREWGGVDLGTIDITKAQDLEVSSMEMGLGVGQFVTPRFITLYPEAQFDIFSFRRFAGFFVSERLKNAIEAAGLTGMRFEPPEFAILQKDQATMSS